MVHQIFAILTLVKVVHPFLYQISFLENVVRAKFQFWNFNLAIFSPLLFEQCHLNGQHGGTTLLK
jgi:hypothetical protein